MTCIAGIAHNGKVYIGADSIASDGYSRTIIATPKVFRRGEFLIGYTSSFRMGQILQHHLDVRPQQENEGNDAYIVVAFVEAVRECLKTHGFATVNNSYETGGSFLVGYRGALYSIQDEYQMVRSANGMDACGAGEQYALAALVALPELLPEVRIRRALEISAELCALVSAPFHIETLG